MDQPDHVTLVIAITVCKVIFKLSTRIDFLHQTDLFGPFVHVSLVPETHLSYFRITLYIVITINLLYYFLPNYLKF